ncbi:MAG: sigma-70 family RNA polymerase sigma factor [Eubacterium sp.]|nr:sigma-70 family RNA polymerase sigma factor [Eubacterium sp.]
MRIETSHLAKTYQDHLFAAAFHICENAADAEDIVQETLLRYHNSRKDFESEEHIRAWLFRVAVNLAKNVRRSFWRHRTVPLEDYMETLTFASPESETLFAEVMHLPEKYRIVIHLFYYEDCSVREISRILKISESNVKVRLNRGRKMLKQTLLEGWDNEDDE